MPEMNGFVLSKKIRRLKKGESIPIIAITTGQIKDHIKLSKKAGIDLTISKPILQDDLNNKLSPYISKILDSKAKIQLNMDFINQIVGDEISEVKEFLKTSLLSICDSKKHIQNDIKQKNFDQLAKSFHKIKGTLLYLDLNKMADQAQKLQNSALHKEENAILKGEAFIYEINDLIQVIEEKISSI